MIAVVELTVPGEVKERQLEGLALTQLVGDVVAGEADADAHLAGDGYVGVDEERRVAGLGQAVRVLAGEVGVRQSARTTDQVVSLGAAAAGVLDPRFAVAVGCRITAVAEAAGLARLRGVAARAAAADEQRQRKGADGSSNSHETPFQGCCARGIPSLGGGATLKSCGNLPGRWGCPG